MTVLTSKQRETLTSFGSAQSVLSLQSQNRRRNVQTAKNIHPTFEQSKDCEPPMVLAENQQVFHNPDDCLNGLPVDSPVKRRASAGRTNMRRILARNASLTNVLVTPIKTTMNSFCESFTETTLSNSVVSLEENELAANVFATELEQEITGLALQKEIVERRIKSTLVLARARYNCGNEIGAILSMRRAHKSKKVKANIAAAGHLLRDARQQVQNQLNSNSFDLDLVQLRRHVRNVISKIEVAMFPTPCDKDLLSELYAILNMIEI